MTMQAVFTEVAKAIAAATLLHGDYQPGDAGLSYRPYPPEPVSIAGTSYFSAPLDLGRSVAMQELAQKMRSRDMSSDVGVEFNRSILMVDDRPFAEIDRRKDNDTKLRELIDDVRTAAALPYGKKLAERLQYLTEVSADEEPDLVVSADSLGHMLRFLRSQPTLACPDVVLSRDGDFCAEWRRSANQRLSAIFLPDGKAMYLVVAPDTGQPGTTSRASGSTSVDTLMEKLLPFAVPNWAAA